jgi:hypothetical protein
MEAKNSLKTHDDQSRQTDRKLADKRLGVVESILIDLYNIVDKYGYVMSTSGANVFFAYQKIKSAIGYLEEEKRLLKNILKS